jgi:hypothetical protein
MKSKIKKISWFNYLELFLGMLLIFPLELAGWMLNFGKMNGLLITVLIHTLLLILGMVMFNYLETGNCFKSVQK